MRFGIVELDVDWYCHQSLHDADATDAAVHDAATATTAAAATATATATAAATNTAADTTTATCTTAATATTSATVTTTATVHDAACDDGVSDRAGAPSSSAWVRRVWLPSRILANAISLLARSSRLSVTSVTSVRAANRYRRWWWTFDIAAATTNRSYHGFITFTTVFSSAQAAKAVAPSL